MLPILTTCMVAIQCNKPYCDIEVIITHVTKRNNQVVWPQDVHM